MPNYEYTCQNCSKIFISVDNWNAEYAMKEHYKYCILPFKHKIMGIILAPMALVAIATTFVIFLLYYILAPLAYPFVYAMSLFLDREVMSWSNFTKSIYGEDRVKSYKKKKI